MPDLTLLEFCLWGYCLLTLLCAGAVTYRYRTLFNPLLYPSLQLLVMAGMAPLAQDIAHSSHLAEGWWMEASLVTSLYLLGLTWPLLVPVNPLVSACEMLIGPLEFSRRRTGDLSRQTPRILCLLYFAVLTGFAAIFFGLLVRDSPVRSLWLTDPRMAYLAGRAGSGHWYVLSQTCLFLAYLGWLYYGRVRDYVMLVAGSAVFLAAFYFFGSKAAMVGVVMAGGVYFNFYIRTFTWGELLACGGLGVPLVLISPFLQGNFDSLTATLQYYDYFENAARYLGVDGRFGPNYGGTFLSSMWEYVPRRVVPSKPFVYGAVVVNEHFFPGAAQVGYTPGYLPWIPLHLDFGLAGVGLGASALGFLNKGIFTYFLRHRSFLGFLCYLQIAFIPVLKLAPVLYFIALLLLLSVSLRAFVLAGNILLGVKLPASSHPEHAMQTIDSGEPSGVRVSAIHFDQRKPAVTPSD